MGQYVSYGSSGGDKIPGRNHLKGLRVYFGLQFVGTSHPGGEGMAAGACLHPHRGGSGSREQDRKWAEATYSPVTQWPTSETPPPQSFENSPKQYHQLGNRRSKYETGGVTSETNHNPDCRGRAR